MPSLVTAKMASTTSATKSFSRVNSFKRDWGNDGEKTPPKNPLKGDSMEIQWTPSPDRPKTVPAPRAVSPTPTLPNVVETAADRRRKAILAALQPNSDLPYPSASSSSAPAPTFKATAKVLVTLDDEDIPSAQLIRETQELPSIPVKQAGSSGDGKKRALPWQEDMSVAKRAMQAGPSGKRPTSAGSGSSKTAVNIKQQVTLSNEQQKVLQLVVGEGKNIFFTGSAGTGKSVLLREIIKALRKKHATAPDAVAVTASTGIAACNIGGTTLHSFGGCGLAKEDPKQLVGKIRKQKKAVARWTRTRVLIVDEVSMVDGEFFDKLCKIGQMIRKNDRPWGGIQIVVTGDFFQLPPVTKGGGMPRFCFEAATWNETVHMSVNLTKVFRQKDQRFVDMLNEMRFGKMTPASIQVFKSLSRPLVFDDNLDATELFPRREDVDKSNMTRLRSLDTDGWTYSATDGGAMPDPIQREKLLDNFLAPKVLALKVDAQVMLIKNTDETLVNGSMGKVIGFCHKLEYEQDQQGRWLEDKRWNDLPDEERERKEAALAIALSKMQQGARPFPVVRFKVPGGGFRDLLVEHESFKVEQPNGEVQASRQQLPLILAWAMSIHKSQGQTLERVKVDLGKVFEKGQAYVALSRATSLEGLQVLGFAADKVMAHRKVAQWSSQLRALD